MPVWNNRFRLLMFAAIALLALHFAYGGSDVVTKWLSLLLLSFLMYVININEAFKFFRFLLTAVIPYLVVMAATYLVMVIDPKSYQSWTSWFQAAETFAIIWGFGTWFITKKQRKELANARKKALEEEENSRVIRAMKEELEVQVSERTHELRQQKEELEIALKELKATQSQLIQSEKMASLGELTAGIAHEIQNPLNFVNNFSEVSNELIDEMKAEMGNGRYEEAREIAEDVKENLEKILHHGKRADAIVKGMLQHSRSSAGQKELTDINALADEYLRLSFHGLRAKDKSFNADFKTNFDEGIGKINIIPQDIGRVLLNLFNNAFYAVNERKSQIPVSYEPTVSVSTEKSQNHVTITVSDNGKGIPKNLVDKIFQPFFTTKPTGEGTGLGLSISYDIIKSHGGSLKVESKEGEGSRFIIQLPIV